MLGRNDKPVSASDLRVFAVGQAVLIGSVLLWSTAGPLGRVEFLVLAASVLAAFVGLLWPQTVATYRRIWIGVLWPVRWAVSWVLLAVVFFGVVTPLGLMLRLTGRQRPVEPGWHPVDTGPVADRLWQTW